MDGGGDPNETIVPVFYMCVSTYKVHGPADCLHFSVCACDSKLMGRWSTAVAGWLQTCLNASADKQPLEKLKKRTFASADHVFCSMNRRDMG